MAKAAKLATGTSQQTMNIDGDLFLSDIKEDEAVIKDE